MQKGVFPLKIKIRQTRQSKFVQNQNLFVFHSVRIYFHYFWSSTLCWHYGVDLPKFGDRNLGIEAWGSLFGNRNLGIETLQNPFERLIMNLYKLTNEYMRKLLYKKRWVGIRAVKYCWGQYCWARWLLSIYNLALNIFAFSNSFLPQSPSVFFHLSLFINSFVFFSWLFYGPNFRRTKFSDFYL